MICELSYPHFFCKFHFNSSSLTPLFFKCLVPKHVLWGEYLNSVFLQQEICPAKFVRVQTS